MVRATHYFDLLCLLLSFACLKTPCECHIFINFSAASFNKNVFQLVLCILMLYAMATIIDVVLLGTLTSRESSVEWMSHGSHLVLRSTPIQLHTFFNKNYMDRDEPRDS